MTLIHDTCLFEISTDSSFLFLASRTEAECASHGFGCIETFVNERFINGFAMSRKNEADCQAVGGQYVPALNWRAVSEILSNLRRKINGIVRARGKAELLKISSGSPAHFTNLIQ